MNIIQVIPYIGAESSGPAYYITKMCSEIQNAGANIELHTLAPLPKQTLSFPCFSYPRHSFPDPRLGRSPEMKKVLFSRIDKVDIIHNNSLWMLPNIYPGQAARKTKVKLVTSPHGTLSPWALRRSHRLKQLIGFLGQNASLNRTDMFHATCEKEYKEIRNAGFLQPVGIIPIGMDPIETFCQKEIGKYKLLFFGRIHPVKGCSNLLKAWEFLQDSFPEWEIVFAGPDGGALSSLKEQCKHNKLSRISFVGEVNGKAKYDLFAQCDLYVLPSYTENFGVTVAEALATGIPVVVSQGTPWQEVEKIGCGSWVQNDPESLVTALSNWMKLSPKKRELAGKAGQNWIRKAYSWSTIGKQMFQSYQWLLGTIEKPDWIITE